MFCRIYNMGRLRYPLWFCSSHFPTYPKILGDSGTSPSITRPKSSNKIQRRRHDKIRKHPWATIAHVNKVETIINIAISPIRRIALRWVVF